MEEIKNFFKSKNIDCILNVDDILTVKTSKANLLEIVNEDVLNSLGCEEKFQDDASKHATSFKEKSIVFCTLDVKKSSVMNLFQARKKSGTMLIFLFFLFILVRLFFFVIWQLFLKQFQLY